MLKLAVLTTRPPANRIVASVLIILLSTIGYASSPASASAQSAVTTDSADSSTSDGNFVPVNSVVVADTRSGLGLPAAKLTAHLTASFSVAGGSTGVPTTGVSAVALNFTLVNTSNTTSFVAWTAGATKPGTTTVTGQPNEYQGGTGYIRPGTNNSVSAQIDAGSADLIVRVIGYFSSSDDYAGFCPLNGTRVVDTTKGIGAPTAKIPAGKYIDISVSTAGVPSSASAAVITLTTFSTVNSYANFGVPGQPYSSTVAVVGDNYANSVSQIVRTGNSMVRIMVGPAANLDVIVDVTGYFGATVSGGGFTPTSGRIFDTRTPGHVAIPAGGTQVLQALATAGIPSYADSVGAIALTLTVASPQAAGHARIYAEGLPEPQIQTVTFDVGDTDSNSTIISTTSPASGRFVIRNQSSAPLNAIVDVQGWFSPFYDADAALVPGISESRVAPEPADQPVYFAAGDSYSSGFALGDYTVSRCPTHNDSDRSKNGYAALLAANTFGSAYGFAYRSCAGAKTYNLRSSVPGGITNARVVTMTIGGNDVDFAKVAKCAANPFPSCKNTFNSALNKARSVDFANQLGATYRYVQRYFPDALLVILTYPNLVDSHCSKYKGGIASVARNTQPINRALNQAIYNQVIFNTNRHAIRGYRLDAVPAFTGHSLCASNGSNYIGVQQLGHPNVQGQRVLFQLVNHIHGIRR